MIFAEADNIGGLPGIEDVLDDSGIALLGSGCRPVQKSERPETTEKARSRDDHGQPPNEERLDAIMVRAHSQTVALSVTLARCPAGRAALLQHFSRPRCT
jgi:hypothetical protein